MIRFLREVVYNRKNYTARQTVTRTIKELF